MDRLGYIAQAVSTVLQDAEIFFDKGKGVLEMFRESLMENQVECFVGERSLEGVAADEFQVFVEVVLFAQAVNDFQAVLCKVQHVYLGA